MPDPYSPPESELKEDAVLTRSVWWKIYFVLITILSFLGMAVYVGAEGSGYAEYLSLFSLVVATAGLFGFCFLKKILSPNFWMVFLIIYFLYGVLYLFITNVDMKAGMNNEEFYLSLAIGYIISLPGYYGIFSYGRSNNPIWSKA